MISCTLEGGEHVSLRHTTVDGLMTRNGLVVLCRRAEGLPEAGNWCLPGGYVDRDETVANALERELEEEVGVRVKTASLFAVMSDPSRDVLERQNISLVFLVTDWEGTPRGGREVSAVEFFRRCDIPDVRDMASDHRDILERFFGWIDGRVTLPLVI